MNFSRNYHTHTTRCGHASGTMREYVEAAIKSGFKTLGFSDHTPYVGFPDGYYSGFRMKPEELGDYCESVKKLAAEYKDEIEIHLGLECEYYPKLFDALLEFIRPFEIEYLILGQHCINNETDGIYSGSINTDKDLVRYVDQCCEALQTGCFTYIAHPDMAGLARDNPAFLREMIRLCECAKKLGIPLEINLLGIRAGRTYPCRELLCAAAQTGNKVILGLDVHDSDCFADKESVEKAQRLIAEYSLEYEENLTLHGEKLK